MIGHYRRCLQALPSAQQRLIVILAIAIALANVAQPFPEVAPLQHIPTAFVLVIAPLLLWRWPLSTRAVGSIVAFLLLHTFAARWTYSNVPYDRWSFDLTGYRIGALFGSDRNGFDRLVHLSFGLFAIRPVAEAMQRYGGTGVRVSLWTAILFVGAVSAVYEIFEWGLSMMVSADLAEDYNGQQGDAWDAQKDMAVAMIGGVEAALWIGRRSRESQLWS